MSGIELSRTVPLSRGTRDQSLGGTVDQGLERYVIREVLRAVLGGRPLGANEAHVLS